MKEFPRIICVTAIDGSGKTKLLQELSTQVKESGAKPQMVWLRFNHYFTKILHVWARLRGLTDYEWHEGHRIGYHNFSHSPLFASLYIWVTVIDAWLARLFSITPRTWSPMSVILIDRFVTDILVDLMIDTGRENLHKKLSGRCLLAALPDDAITIAIHRPKAAVLSARPDFKHDRNFERRWQLYEDLYTSLDLPVFHNDSNFDVLVSKVSQHLESVAPKAASQKSQPSLQWHNPRFILLLLKNWLFQGMRAMGPHERVVKVGFDFILTIIFFSWSAIAGLKGLAAAWLLAHTCNWLFNGHLFVLLRHVLRQGVPRERFTAYAANLRERAIRSGYIDGIAVYGSYARNRVHERSDLDVRIVVLPAGSFFGALFCLRERMRALLLCFPLEIYLSVDGQGLEKIHSSERPVILLDQSGLLAKYYATTPRTETATRSAAVDTNAQEQTNESA